MGPMIFLGVFFTFLFAGTVLILTFGYQAVEEERAKTGKASTEAPAPRVRSSRFFGPVRPAEPATPDEAMLMRVQRYLDAEQAIAEQFVSEPSVESLYRGAEERVHLN